MVATKPSTSIGQVREWTASVPKLSNPEDLGVIQLVRAGKFQQDLDVEHLVARTQRPHPILFVQATVLWMPVWLTVSGHPGLQTRRSLPHVARTPAARA